MRKRPMRLFRFALCALLLFACLFSSASALESPSALTLLFTTDIHSNLVPHLTLIDGKSARMGGFARLKTALDANFEPGKTLLLDSGDFSTGTLYQNFTLSDALDLRLMDKLNYDAVALGNHDYDMGEDTLKAMLEHFRADGGELCLLAGNLINAGESKIGEGPYANPLAPQGVQNYTVIERAGYRIGLFSIMGKDAISYTAVSEYAFASPVKSAQRIVNTLREKENVDLVILLSHAGILPDGSYTEDAEIARAVKGIDIILSGHEHVPFSEMQKVDDTMIVCAGTALNYLGRMELYQRDGRWTADYSLIPLDERWVEDAEVASLIAPYTKKLNAGYLHDLGVEHGITEDFAFSPYDFYDGDVMGLELGDYAFGRLLTDGYFHALEQEGIDDVQVAMIPTGTVRGGLYKGNLKVMDVYNVLSYGASPLDGSSGAPIACIHFTGSGLYDLCETSVSLSPFISSAQFLFGGLRYSYSSARPILDKVYQLEVYSKESGEYEPVVRDDRRLYKVAVSWTSLQSIDLINSSAYRLLRLEPRDASGKRLEAADFPSCIVKRKNGQELKEWYTLYSYLDSMPCNEAGLNVIDAKYNAPGGFVVKQPCNPSLFFANPSRAAKLMLKLLCALVILIVLLFRHLRRVIKKRSLKKDA